MSIWMIIRAEKRQVIGKKNRQWQLKIFSTNKEQQKNSMWNMVQIVHKVSKKREMKWEQWDWWSSNWPKPRGHNLAIIFLFLIGLQFILIFIVKNIGYQVRIQLIF